MSTIFVDPTFSHDTLRRKLYNGDLVMFKPRRSAAALCSHTHDMIQQAFKGMDPQKAQFSMSVEEYVSIVAPLKPQFIHHPKTKRLIQDLLVDYGMDPEETYFDVPRLRMVTSDAYLTSGVGYAHHPHRDTWYSAPMQQFNWWLPIYDITADSTIAFHPYYWDHPVQNGSRHFNYYEWNGLRKSVANHVKSDTRFQPKPDEPLDHLEPEIRTVCEGQGIILFSGAHLHSTVPNTSGVTRYSIDFRTVNFRDVVNKTGAPNIDSEPQGTSLRDFMHGVTLERMAPEVIALYEERQPTDGVLTFIPNEA